jgi:spermidine synthase/MFS family permease
MTGFAVRLLPYALAFFSSLCIMILELVASRLVARHVGASLSVWTSVIGIMLGGICLGNVLGGRLADRAEPRRLLGPLYAIGSALTLGCLWMNAVVGGLPGLGLLPWDLRTVVVVTLDFLVPGTVLGMIGPVVAKMAVEQARKAGTALGDVYFLGAVGSIVGTFFAGFVLIYVAPTSTIVMVVAAALALLAAALMADTVSIFLGVGAALMLALGSAQPMYGALRAPGVVVGSVFINALALVGQVLVLVLAVRGARLLRASIQPLEIESESELPAPSKGRGRKQGEPALRSVSLTDLAALSFLASLVFMSLEMVAGRMVQRHLGSSVYGWTSVIGVLLGGLSLGNLLGGKIADHVREEKQASWLFLAASVLTLSVLLLETPPTWLAKLMHDPAPDHHTPILVWAITMTGVSWPLRVLAVTAMVFLLPSVALGTVSPVVAKLAVERMRRSKRTGMAIGQVYAWGMVGSILGTFVTGFLLIQLLGTKGLVLLLGTAMALAATMLGTVWHALWAGIPLGLCIIAFLPIPWLERKGVEWGIREERGDPQATKEEHAYIHESNYYYIKVDNEPDPEGQKRTLVLDNLIHGYVVLDHPERLDYDYEHIYGLVTYRVAKAKAKALNETDLKKVPLRTMFLGGGSYTYPRYLQHTYPLTTADVAEIDTAVTKANHIALGLPRNTTIQTTWGDARQYVERNQNNKQYDLIFGDAFNDFSVPWHLTTREFNEKLAKMLAPDGVYMINIIDLYESLGAAEKRGRSEAIEAARAAARKRAERSKAGEDAIAKAVEEAKPTPEEIDRAVARAKKEALECGGFLGAWVKTARLTFPFVYVFGTDDVPGDGGRETFVVVASKIALDLDDMGNRDQDPKFYSQKGRLSEPRAYSQSDLDALNVRSHGIVLTDDYAPVENLLAPVAATRGKD